MAEKFCHECQHYRRMRTGPHEWAAHCDLHQADFFNADQCGQYAPCSFVLHNDDEGERWPASEYAP